MRTIDGDALWEKAYEVWGLEADAGDTSIFMNMITDAPTIDPVKHGRWISIGEGYHWRFECSECHWKDGYPFDDRHSYCPNCGARMDANE